VPPLFTVPRVGAVVLLDLFFCYACNSTYSFFFVTLYFRDFYCSCVAAFVKSFLFISVIRFSYSLPLDI
jgi:hypothetical protein